MTAINLSRRQALLGTAAMTGAASLGAIPMPTALAKAPMANDQAPYFYRFKHGNMQATVVSDGILPLGDPSASFLGTSKEEIGKMLTDNFLSPTNVINGRPRASRDAAGLCSTVSRQRTMTH